MGKKGFSRTGMGMFFQAFGMFFFIGGLFWGEFAQILLGLCFFLFGLVIYWTAESTLLTYARDWVYTFFIFCLMMDVVSFMVLITGGESFLTAIGGLLICVLVTIGMSKFSLFMNQKWFFTES